jgi:hypothetical protein
MTENSIPRAYLALLAGALHLGCNVDATEVNPEGVTLSNTPQATARGFTVVNSDMNYEAYSVSVLGLDGQVQSASIISSGSAELGLSAPLTDVVMPSSAVPGPELVVINRAPASFLSWVDLATASVRAQLNVGTGFESNPYDYVQISDSKAYVTRHSPNFASGKEPFDQGNDVLIVDPREPAITGSIDLMPVLEGEPVGFFPRAGRALLVGGRVRILALGLDKDYLSLVDSRIVSIDPTSDSITDVLVLEGLSNCQSMALSPNGQELSVGCSGPFGADPAEGFPNAGIALVEVGAELRETRRFGSAELGGSTIGSVSYASASSLAFTSYGRFNADFSAMEVADSARRLDLESGSVDISPLRESSLSPFTLGDISCEPTARTCLLTDAETDGGVVHRFEVSRDGALVNGMPITLEKSVGLSPRSIGLY